MTSLRDHFTMFAYNAWANRRLYAAAGALPDDAYRADRGAFFGSVRGTLNHLLVTDRVWLQRISATGDAPDRLDAILFDRFDELAVARTVEDARIVRVVGAFDDASLQGEIRYRRVTTPEPFAQGLASALAHWFKHQTHHRGQAHVLISGLGHRPPEMDLLFFQREVAPAATG